MDESDLRELQLATLGILKDVRDVCARHGIRFYLAYGTLIGAIRHQGFIPWDDDIDIMMMREDYERLFAVRDELGENYIVQDYRTTPEFWSFHAKIRLLWPKPFRDTQVSHLTDKDGLFIDIFVLDHVPARRSPAVSAMTVLLDYTRLVLSAHQYGQYDPSPLIRTLSVVAKAVPKRLLARIMNWGCGHWNDHPTDWVVCWGGVVNHVPQISPASDFGGPVMVDFEDDEMPVPAEYDAWLTQFYGDYMQAPPPGQRGSTHSFVRVGDAP
ncbi:MAG: LicD family protein [Propionibacteriaceae bacterium]|jgi:lipopolysaccharide cholinephosphotransferase|nr:LicD family protein [Propionibacteriaceae bacterium]